MSGHEFPAETVADRRRRRHADCLAARPEPARHERVRLHRRPAGAGAVDSRPARCGGTRPEPARAGRPAGAGAGAPPGAGHAGADPDGARRTVFDGIAIEINEDHIVIDFNHPLAGEDLYFSGKIVKVEDAPKK